jgi:hypothetical protein
MATGNSEQQRRTHKPEAGSDDAQLTGVQICGEKEPWQTSARPRAKTRYRVARQGPAMGAGTYTAFAKNFQRRGRTELNSC